MKEMEDVIKREIRRLNEISLEGPLKAADVKLLESLTRSWKAYSGNRIDPDGDVYEDLTKEELVALAGMDIDEEGTT